MGRHENAGHRTYGRNTPDMVKVLQLQPLRGVDAEEALHFIEPEAPWSQRASRSRELEARDFLQLQRRQAYLHLRFFGEQQCVGQ